MSAGGTLNSMVISLKNNRDLLIRRTNYFDRKRSESEMRRIYSNRIQLDGPALTKAQKERIRAQVREEYRKEKRTSILIFSGMFFALSVVIYLCFSAFNAVDAGYEQVVIQEATDTNQTYQEQLDLGLKYLRQGEPFYAIGYFKTALEVRPRDAYATESLIEAYEALCQKDERSCENAQRAIHALRND
jgi:hypothetical protein